MAMAFKTIRARAEKRKGGPKALKKLLPPKSRREAARQARRRPRAGRDDEAHLLRRLRLERDRGQVGRLRGGLPRLRAGDACFPARRVLGRRLTSDTAIVRNGAKIMSVRDNARFVADIAASTAASASSSPHGRPSDEVGLLELLAKRGSRLGGNTGQIFLRFLGKDGFVTSNDVVACLRDAGLDIAESATSKRDLAKVQDHFNAWAKETGLPICTSRASARCRSARITRRANWCVAPGAGIDPHPNGVARVERSATRGAHPQSVIPGCASWRRPEIHNPRPWLSIL